MRFLFLSTLVLQTAVALTALASGQTQDRQLALENGGTLDYVLQLPEDFDEAKAYPVLLALPPGKQNRAMVDAGLNLYWAEQGLARSWVVVSPVAPGPSFYSGSEVHLPALLDEVAKQVQVAGGRVHVAGPSNGGRSAFRFALGHPDRTASLLVLPGFPPTAEDEKRLINLLEMPVEFLVGGDDEAWVVASQRAHDALKQLGHQQLKLRIFPGEGHSPKSVTSHMVFDSLDAAHELLMRAEKSRSEVADVLDAFHLAAAQADGEAYFSHFAPGAVFLGTDPQERWTIPEFRAFAAPYFGEGRGWTYIPTARHITLGPGGNSAWFDEALDNKSYGETRGTGVLRRLAGTWRIAQYSLSIPVPNELAADLVQRIRGSQPAKEGGK